MPEPENGLFLCTGNSCRFQTFAGRARHIGSEELSVLSAGSGDKIMDEVRATRDEVERRVRNLLDTIRKGVAQ